MLSKMVPFKLVWSVLMVFGAAVRTQEEDAFGQRDPSEDGIKGLGSIPANDILIVEDKDNRPCIMVKMEARLIIQKMGNFKSNDKKSNILYIPVHPTTSGRCADTTGNQSELTIIWATPDGSKYRLKHTFAAEQKESSIKQTLKWIWTMKNVTLDYTSPIQRKGRKISCYITGKSPISAPLQQSFLCKHALNVTLSNPTTGNCDVILQYKAHLQIRAYNLENSDVFGNTYLCDRSKEIGLLASLKSASTISCGFILAVCAVCTIVIHSAKRTWFTARQPYMTLN